MKYINDKQIKKLPNLLIQDKSLSFHQKKNFIKNYVEEGI